MGWCVTIEWSGLSKVWSKVDPITANGENVSGGTGSIGVYVWSTSDVGVDRTMSGDYVPD